MTHQGMSRRLDRAAWVGLMAALDDTPRLATSMGG
jgi:hypothetical protein